MVTIDLNLADIKLESSEAFFAEVRGKIGRRISKLFTFFVKMQF